MHGANERVTKILVEADGRMILTGWFSRFNGSTRWGIARVDLDGSLNPTFGPSISGDVYDAELQTDGKILIVGNFLFSGRNDVARLNADGTVDTTFLNGLSGANQNVNSVALQPDGRIIVGGAFTSVNGVARSRIARLNADGTVDTTFLDGLSGADGTVNAVALQADGKLLIGGNFLECERDRPRQRRSVERGRFARHDLPERSLGSDRNRMGDPGSVRREGSRRRRLLLGQRGGR